MLSENNPENQIKPLISIIIPFYNTADFLREAIESVLVQSLNEWEIILVNDGSTDKSVEIAMGFVEKHSDQIYLFNHNNENKGTGASRNLGIAKARGKFITFLDSDDVYFPDTLERELNAFARNPEADAVCGTAECWFSWSDKSKKREKDFIIDLVTKSNELYQPPDLLIHSLTVGGRKPHPNCVMVKSEFANKIGAFEQNFRTSWEDNVSWAKITLNGKIYVLDAVLARYRLYPESTYAVEMKNGQDIRSKQIFLDWLENYLKQQKIENKDVWKAFHSFRRKASIEKKFKKIKQAYRQFLPLNIRFKIRDKLTRSKQILSRSAHRQK